MNHTARHSEALAGLILCGGKSTRMGRSKAHLPFGEQTMLARMVSILRDVCQPLIIVAAEGQELPELPDTLTESKESNSADDDGSPVGLKIARDQRPGRGPLEGLITGLKALRELHPDATHVYATSCDVPLLSPKWPLALMQRIGEASVAVPCDEKYHHPLAAVYRTSVLTALEQLSHQDELRPRRLFDVVDTVRVPVEQLRDIDRELNSLKNLNSPEDYIAALQQCDLAVPADMRTTSF